MLMGYIMEFGVRGYGIDFGHFTKIISVYVGIVCPTRESRKGTDRL